MALKMRNLEDDRLRYFCIDFETANQEPGSICSVGLVCVKDGTVEKEYYSLVNPETWFDDFCVAVHGITEKDVAAAPKLGEMIEVITPIITEYSSLVAHYSAFDVRHLIGAYHKCNIQLPELDNIICTRSVSRRAYPGRISYSLHNLTDLFNCDYEAHNALGDAKACNELFKSCLAHANAHDISDLCKALRIRSGSIHAGVYTNCIAKPISTQTKISVLAANGIFDIDHPFYQSEIVFTGALASMSRKDAAQLVVDVGGIFSDALRKTTNYLVMGMQDISKFNGKEKSAKTIKAESLLAAGADIQIIGEDEFIKLLQLDGKTGHENIDASDAFVNIPDCILRFFDFYDEFAEFENLPAGVVGFKPNKSGFSAMFESTLFCRFITDNGSVSAIRFTERFDDAVRECFDPSNVFTEKNKDITISTLDDSVIPACRVALRKALTLVLDAYPRDFDCCNTFYLKDYNCSDAKHCISKNKEIAMGCEYKKKLRKGIYIMGKNRNIDKMLK